MTPAADIDRLIEEGLNRYGTGDLDGALHLWEQVLAIDPENAQANSYVDYVRLNYEVLQTDSGLGVTTDGAAPFGIEDEPEYIIEITRGEIEPGTAPMYIEPTDEGWFIEEEQTHELFARTRSGRQIEPKTEPKAEPKREPKPTARPEPAPRTISADLPPKHIELEADEPPELELAPPAPQRAPSAEVTFDSATREYGADSKQPPPLDRQEDSGAFRPEATPAGFSNLDTAIRKRDLGFVQPTQGQGAPAQPAPLEVRLRTPSASPPPASATPSNGGDLERGSAGRSEPTTSELGKTARGIPPVSRAPAPSHPPPTRSPTEDDLILSLPSPRRVSPLRCSQPPPLDPASRIPTRELPEQTRPPAATPTDRAETKQGGPNGEDDEIALSGASTRDLGLRALGDNDFAVNAPTKDLGLRMPDAGRAQPVTKRPPSVFPDEDAPTRQSDARQIREEHSTQKLKALKKTQPGTPTGGSSEGTRKDIVLPFDPIDARTAQILDAIQPPGGEPSGETKEDRTRRRITALIERAGAWSTSGELDKAVAAVDMALSEDPDTALAQKLIHRNRDAIMNIFQLFLGDLERQPQLARPLHELATAPISPRAAFLLSRIDGTLSIDEILDVSGMPRLEAYRHLCQLFLRGILR